ncbi:hypothetical protein KSP39_PZI004286 [Platanthera zijinensis]|uniref:Retrotransposon gag domain-containing protein n=1 Tax=Platanthera zijinensis TaxID=2320716 RepID=A0AAP0GCE2_9ASPA
MRVPVSFGKSQTIQVTRARSAALGHTTTGRVPLFVRGYLFISPKFCLGYRTSAGNSAHDHWSCDTDRALMLSFLSGFKFPRMARRPATRSTPLSEGESSGAQNDAVIESLRQSNDSMGRQLEEVRAQIQSLVAVVAGQTQGVQVPAGGLAVPPPPAPLRPPVVVPAEMAFISQFQRLSPPTYDGKADFMVIGDWLISMEEIFSYSGIADDQRVMIAAYQLKGLAKSWWLREKESLVAGCSWEVFKEMLLRKFLPSVECDRLMNDFLHLKQRQLTVGEYEIEFSKLSRFAPGLVNVEADPS